MNLLAQYELLDLAGRRFGNRSEHHRLWGLEARHPGAAKGYDLRFAGALILLQFDERAGHFAPFRVRLCNHGGEQYRRMLVEHVLDLDRADVLATGNDDVL